MDWDVLYLKTAIQEATNSPDPRTQNGAIIVKNNTTIISRGHNRFPKNVNYKEKRWNRPEKYFYIEHAERNAIFSAIRSGVSPEGSTLYCPWFACADCSRAIIQTGIVRCVGLKMDEKLTNPKWHDTILAGNEMLDEAGIERVYIEIPKIGIQLKRNGKLIDF